jgi:hypothetical protein
MSPGLAAGHIITYIDAWGHPQLNALPLVVVGLKEIPCVLLYEFM